MSVRQDVVSVLISKTVVAEASGFPTRNRMNITRKPDWVRMVENELSNR